MMEAIGVFLLFCHMNETRFEAKNSLYDDPCKRFPTTKGQSLVNLDFLGGGLHGSVIGAATFDIITCHTFNLRLINFLASLGIGGGLATVGSTIKQPTRVDIHLG